MTLTVVEDVPEDPAEALVADVVGQLLREPDPVIRWRAVDALRAGRLGWVQGLTVTAMSLDGMDGPTIGAALGITKQRVGQLLDKQESGPAYAWGRLLGLLSWLAAGVGTAGSPKRDRATTGAEHLIAAAWSTTTVRARVETMLAQLLRDPRHRPRAEAHQLRVGELEIESADTPARLGITAQGQAILGYHHERGDLTRIYPAS